MKPTPHVDDKLVDLVYGELPAPEAQAVKEHVHGCAECASALESIQGVRRAMSQLPEEPPPAGGLDSLLAYAEQAARRAQAGPSPKPAWWRKWLVPLAGTAALVVVGVVASQLGRSTAALEDQAVAPAAPAPAPPPAAAAPASPPAADLAEPRKTEAAPPPVDAPARRAAHEAKRLAVKEDVADDKESAKARGVANAGEEDAFADRSGEARLDKQGAFEGATGHGVLGGAPAVAKKAKVALKDEAPVDVGYGGGASTQAPVAERAAPAAAQPAPVAAVAKGAVSADPVLSFSQAAQVAHRAGDYRTEVALLGQAVASGPEGSTLKDLLARLCDAQYLAKQALDACSRLLQEFPTGPGAEIARRRLRSAPATRDERAPAREKSAPAPAEPAQRQ